jgi:lipopolysaccharide/colanic/teichoic acid biosynthesis glycosyltransferase
VSLPSGRRRHRPPMAGLDCLPKRSKRAAVRVLDLVLGALGLAVTAPVQAVIAALVRLLLGRPVVFRQPRPGRNQELFVLLKFRTMTEAHGSDGLPLSDMDRITPFGAFLRSTSLDELPSLINVLKGEMSLVGPRPLLNAYLPFYTEREQRRFLVRPGITGLAQVSGRNSVEWDDRLALDVDFVENYGPWLYLRILARTLKSVALSTGVDVVPSDRMERLDRERKHRTPQ